MGFDTGEVDLLAADLAVAPAKVTVECIGAVRRTARQMERDAKRFAPVRTGLLHDSIEVEVHGLSAELSANTRYAGYVEYGTSDTRAQPYMRPAAALAGGRLADAAGDAGEHIL